MTTTIGSQLRPYVSEKTEEKNSIPCEAVSFDWNMPRGVSLPEGKIPHPKHPSLGLCPNEATWEGMCPVGDTSANVCDECHTRLVLGETESNIQQRRPHGRITILYKDCRGLGFGEHPPHHEWSWFKK